MPRHLKFKTLSLSLLACLAAPAWAADLVEAYQMARESDPQLQAAEATRLSFGEGVVQSRAALLPNISGQASLEDRDRESGGLQLFRNDDGGLEGANIARDTDDRARTYSLSLRQSIYNHANYTRLRGSRETAARAEADYQASLQGLAFRTAEAYFNVLTAEDSLAFAQAEEKAVGRQLEQADQRFEVGLTAITDVHEARARYDGARANVITAENALDDAREALAELTGTYIENVRPLRPELPLARPTPESPDDWVKVALENSPTLLARELSLRSAEYLIETQRAAHLPTLDLSLGYTDYASWGTLTTTDIVNGPSREFQEGWSATLTLNVPIFEGGATQSRVRQAIYDRDAAQDQVEVERRAVIRSSRNAYRAVLAGISSVEARKQAVVSAQSALEATEAGFEVGTRTIVDVLLSQQTLFQAQRDYSSARHQFILNGLRLKQAAGTIGIEDLQEVNALLQ